MGIGKKKPAGLKKAAKETAKQPAAEPQEPQEQATDPDTLAVPMSQESSGDEVAEVSAMLEIALAKLETPDDAEEGALLLRGVVHESDRILRSRFEHEDPNAPPPQPLPSSFHLAYGSALFRLGLLLLEDEDGEGQESEALQYVEAAIDRYETGLDNDEADWKLNDALARALIEKANLTLRSDETFPLKNVDAIITSAFKRITTALKSLGSSDLNESVSVIVALVRHAQMREDVEGGKKWLNLARIELNKLLKVDPTHVLALQTLAQTYMTAVNDLLDAGENGQEIDLGAVQKLIDEALKYLNKAESVSETSNVKLQLLLGEVYVNKANLLDEADDETKANEFYKKAVECFKRVEELDSSALPEAFDSFLKEWEEDLN
ncbi:hypothetical protein HDU77_002303 [Chytriomyces hyalinus]|nr:hypothetical protein HDU77_002303 [Chytriomyces hyalinus]